MKIIYRTNKTLTPFYETFALLCFTTKYWLHKYIWIIRDAISLFYSQPSFILYYYEPSFLLGKNKRINNLLRVGSLVLLQKRRCNNAVTDCLQFCTVRLIREKMMDAAVVYLVQPHSVSSSIEFVREKEREREKKELSEKCKHTPIAAGFSPDPKVEAIAVTMSTAKEAALVDPVKYSRVQWSFHSLYRLYPLLCKWMAPR